MGFESFFYLFKTKSKTNRVRSSVTPLLVSRLHWMLIPGSLALDTVLGLLSGLLK